MNGKPLFLVHHSINENLVYLDIRDKKIYLKYFEDMRGLHAFSSFHIHTRRITTVIWYLIASFGFNPKKLTNFKLLIFLIKYSYHHINPIHLSGSFYLLYGILLSCSILFSYIHSLKCLIGFCLATFVG